MEQGGVNSSDLYQILNNEQLSVPQETSFGVNFSSSEDVQIASICQADDTVLISNDLVKLKFLLKLTLNFCKKYHIELSSTKTKLQVYLPPSLSSSEDFYKNMVNIHNNNNMVNIDIDGTPIMFVDSTEHVVSSIVFMEIFHS